MKSRLIEVMNEGQRYRFKGCFDKFTIPDEWVRLKREWETNPPKIIDLAEVEECDSALIALLVEAKRFSSDLTIDSIPENLVQLLELYQVKELFS